MRDLLQLVSFILLWWTSLADDDFCRKKADFPGDSGVIDLGMYDRITLDLYSYFEGNNILFVTESTSDQTILTPTFEDLAIVQGDLRLPFETCFFRTDVNSTASLYICDDNKLAVVDFDKITGAISSNYTIDLADDLLCQSASVSAQNGFVFVNCLAPSVDPNPNPLLVVVVVNLNNRSVQKSERISQTGELIAQSNLASVTIYLEDRVSVFVYEDRLLTVPYFHHFLFFIPMKETPGYQGMYVAGQNITGIDSVLRFRTILATTSNTLFVLFNPINDNIVLQICDPEALNGTFTCMEDSSVQYGPVKSNSELIAKMDSQDNSKGTTVVFNGSTLLVYSMDIKEKQILIRLDHEGGISGQHVTALGRVDVVNGTIVALGKDSTDRNILFIYRTRDGLYEEKIYQSTGFDPKASLVRLDGYDIENIQHLVLANGTIWIERINRPTLAFTSHEVLPLSLSCISSDGFVVESNISNIQFTPLNEVNSIYIPENISIYSGSVYRNLSFLDMGLSAQGVNISLEFDSITKDEIDPVVISSNKIRTTEFSEPIGSISNLISLGKGLFILIESSRLSILTCVFRGLESTQCTKKWIFQTAILYFMAYDASDTHLYMLTKNNPGFDMSVEQLLVTVVDLRTFEAARDIEIQGYIGNMASMKFSYIDMLNPVLYILMVGYQKNNTEEQSTLIHIKMSPASEDPLVWSIISNKTGLVLPLSVCARQLTFSGANISQAFISSQCSNSMSTRVYEVLLNDSETQFGRVIKDLVSDEFDMGTAGELLMLVDRSNKRILGYNTSYGALTAVEFPTFELNISRIISWFFDKTNCLVQITCEIYGQTGTHLITYFSRNGTKSDRRVLSVPSIPDNYQYVASFFNATDNAYYTLLINVTPAWEIVPLSMRLEADGSRVNFRLDDYKLPVRSEDVRYTLTYTVKYPPFGLVKQTQIVEISKQVTGVKVVAKDVKNKLTLSSNSVIDLDEVLATVGPVVKAELIHPPKGLTLKNRLTLVDDLPGLTHQVVAVASNDRYYYGATTDELFVMKDSKKVYSTSDKGSFKVIEIIKLTDDFLSVSIIDNTTEVKLFQRSGESWKQTNVLKLPEHHCIDIKLQQAKDVNWFLTCTLESSGQLKILLLKVSSEGIILNHERALSFQTENILVSKVTSSISDYLLLLIWRKDVPWKMEYLQCKSSNEGLDCFLSVADLHTAPFLNSLVGVSCTPYDIDRETTFSCVYVNQNRDTYLVTISVEFGSNLMDNKISQRQIDDVRNIANMQPRCWAYINSSLIVVAKNKNLEINGAGIRGEPWTIFYYTLGGSKYAISVLDSSDLAFQKELLSSADSCFIGSYVTSLNTTGVLISFDKISISRTISIGKFQLSAERLTGSTDRTQLRIYQIDGSSVDTNLDSLLRIESDRQSTIAWVRWITVILVLFVVGLGGIFIYKYRNNKKSQRGDNDIATDNISENRTLLVDHSSRDDNKL